MLKKYDFITLLSALIATISLKLIFSFHVRVAKGFPLLLNRRLILISSNLTIGKYNRIECVHDNSAIEFGDNVKLNDFVHIGAVGKMIIGSRVLIGSRVTIVDHDHGRYVDDDTSINLAPDQRALFGEDITIGDDVWIGEGAVVLKGVILASGTIVAANSVVTKSYSGACILAGIPARPIKKYCAVERAWLKT
jgi:lipopolysaccharide O-acetyltransferase